MVGAQGEKQSLRVSAWPLATLGALAAALLAAAGSVRQVIPSEKRRQMERHTGFVATTTPNPELWEGEPGKSHSPTASIAYVLQTAFKCYGL